MRDRELSFWLFLGILVAAVANGNVQQNNQNGHRHTGQDQHHESNQLPSSNQVPTVAHTDGGQNHDNTIFNHCGMVTIPAQCSCSNHSTNALNIYCDKIGFTKLPNLHFGLARVHTLSLESNNLTSIETGDFFGLVVSRLVLRRNLLMGLNILTFWGLEYYLDSLDLGHNLLPSVPADSLKLLRNLRSLSLEGNRITTLYSRDFASCERLEVLTLDKNPISTIQPDAFIGTNLYLLSMNSIDLKRGLWSIPTTHLGTVKALSLASNNIGEIPTAWFETLHSLLSLNLDGNLLGKIDPNSFEGAEKSLKTLELNANSLKKIPKHTMRRLINLEALELTHNRIRKVHARSFNCSKKLLTLDLSFNTITEIHPFAFEGMESVEKIDLRNNALITLDENTFHWKGSHLREVFLAENRWLCNCLLKWMKRGHKKRHQGTELIADIIDLRCERPEFLYGHQIIRVPIRDLTCDHDYYYYYYYEQPEY